MPDLFVLLYVSTAAAEIADTGVAAITRSARRRNLRCDITGLLAFDGDTFLQWLEGSEAELLLLLNGLRRDPRHHDIEVLVFEAAEGPRHFGSWDLGYHFVEDEADALNRFRGRRGGAAIADFLRLAEGLDVGVGTENAAAA